MEGVFHLESLVETELGYSETIGALAAATEAKDPGTQGHTVRVAEIAYQLGEAMKLPRERLRILAWAGLLHDIGKLGVPDTILLKPGKLTDEEFEVIKRHPDLGHEILARIGSLGQETYLIRLHHERMDGKGYPRSLSAEDLRLEAWILGVGDVYDALVTQRPWRPAFSPEQAIPIMQEEAGDQLEPDVVEALVRIMAHDQGQDTG